VGIWADGCSGVAGVCVSKVEVLRAWVMVFVLGI
jgi:hypothetical protein